MGRSASVVEDGLATQCAIRKEDAGLIGSAEGMETTPAFARPFARRPVGLSWLGGFALLALAFYAAVALLQPIVAAIAGAGGARALALGASRAPVFPGADRHRRRGVRDLRDSTQRLARLLAIARPVGGRLSLRSARRDDRADHLRWRFDPGAHRRLSGTAPHRGA